MKRILGVMFLMFVGIVPLGEIWSFIFMKMAGGGIDQTFIYPIYGGIILLSGLIVGCTSFILEELEKLRTQIANIDKQKDEIKEM